MRLIKLALFLLLMTAPLRAQIFTANVTAVPNPITVCDGSGLGVATVSWSTLAPSEVHVGGATGPMFAGNSTYGTQATGKWVSEGTVFSLVNSGVAYSSTTVHLTTSGCGSSGVITASPNPIVTCDGSGMGVTTISWTSQGQIHVGSPGGPLFAEGGAGSKETGKWVSNGTTFFLTANGTTLGSTTVSVGCN